jgi:hypothetical protein
MACGFEDAYYRAKRALAHLMFKEHELMPAKCDGCKEIALFLTLPGYRGDEDYPVGVSFDVPR